MAAAVRALLLRSRDLLLHFDFILGSFALHLCSGLPFDPILTVLVYEGYFFRDFSWPGHFDHWLHCAPHFDHQEPAVLATAGQRAL